MAVAPTRRPRPLPRAARAADGGGGEPPLAMATGDTATRAAHCSTAAPNTGRRPGCCHYRAVAFVTDEHRLPRNRDDDERGALREIAGRNRPQTTPPGRAPKSLRRVALQHALWAYAL